MASRNSVSPSSRSRWLRWSSVGLVALTVLAYYRTLAVPFLFDDIPAIVANPAIAPLWPPTADLWSNPAGGVTTTGRPLTALSFAIDHAFHGLDPAGYHGVNLALHLCNGLLLLALLRRLTPSANAWFAPAVSALWLVHPLNTAAVTVIVQRAELLAAAGILLACYGLTRFATAPAIGPERTRWICITWIACALGMAAKETAAIAPVLLLLIDRAGFATTWRDVFTARGRTHAFLASTWIVPVVLALTTAGRGETAGFASEVSPWSYLLTQSVAICGYLRRALLPYGLTFDYGTPQFSAPLLVIPAVVLIVAIIGATILLWRKRPLHALPLAAFFVLLAPSSSFVPVASQTIAEHRMYLPLAACLALAGVGLIRWVKAPWLRIAIPSILLVLTATTWSRNEVFRDATTLWSDTVAKAPSNPRAHHNLALALLDQNDAAGALKQLDQAATLEPNSPETAYNRGLALSQLQRLAEAREAYKNALRLDPDHAEAANNLGNLFLANNDPASALTWHRRAVSLKPDWPEAQLNLALSCLANQLPAEALTAARHAAHARPDWADAHFTLAQCLALNGRPAEAIDQLDTVLRLRPDHLQAHQARIELLIDTRRYPEAVAACERLLQLTPDDDHARQLLVWLRAQR